jgi:coenzyme F420-0:L-glutamate ligase/coenzyme F420-1:gamma-L-glutamate ligase
MGYSPADKEAGMGAEVRIIGVTGLPEVQKGDNLSHLILQAVRTQGEEILSGDIVVITQKIISKAEGQVYSLQDIVPSPFAYQIAQTLEKDPRLVEIILRQSRRIVRMDKGVCITETLHGFICANAGVDESNVAGEAMVTVLPEDPDRSAETLRLTLQATLNRDIAVVISDTFGRPWREGITNMAIGVAGLLPLRDYRGMTDPHGHLLRVTILAIADELAAAAELVMGKVDQVPVAIIRGYDYPKGAGSIKQLLRLPERDLFR